MNYIPPPPLPPPMTGFTLNAPPPPPMANLNNATPSVGVSSVNSLAYIEPDPRSALLESIRAGKNLKVRGLFIFCIANRISIATNFC